MTPDTTMVEFGSSLPAPFSSAAMVSPRYLAKDPSGAGWTPALTVIDLSISVGSPGPGVKDPTFMDATPEERMASMVSSEAVGGGRAGMAQALSIRATA